MTRSKMTDVSSIVGSGVACGLMREAARKLNAGIPPTDEQCAREEFATKNSGKWNPYGALPQMRLLTYQMPDELTAVASAGEFDEFDLNEFFAATGTGNGAQFKHKDEEQTWLNIIRGSTLRR